MARERTREWGRWAARGPVFREGGQARLYIVVDTTGEFSGEYVLKELKNPKRLDRFNNELQAIASLSEHPNVVPLIDQGIYRDPKKPCFVMPKADRTFEDLIATGAIDMEERMRIFDSVCEGVAYLHTQSIIHRDLKPENILMFAGVPKVADLGLCLIGGAARVTPSSEVVGSRFYMAPELEDGRQPNVDFTSDVYSLGKVLYFALSGGKVFSREKHGARDWRLSRLTNDSRMELFDPVFDKSITAESRQRYKNAADLQEGFRKALHEFRNHPMTTLLTRFGDIRVALKSPQSELRSLSGKEWTELLTRARENQLGITQDLLNAACDSLDGESVRCFSEVILDNESRLDSDFLSHAAGRILCVQEHDVWFDLWLHSERFSRLAMHALRRADDAVLNATAKWSILTLRDCEEVITKLAERFPRLQPEAVRNFLIASEKTSYAQKEQLLLSLSHDEDMDNESLEAVVAGMCACATPTAISRVIEMADKKEMDDRGKAVARGIVLGSSPSTSMRLVRHPWRNPVMKVLIEAMQRAVRQDD